MTNRETLENFLNCIFDLSNNLVSDLYGEEADWHKHIGEEWNTPEFSQKITDPAEKYLLKTLWDIRLEIANALDSATPESIQEILGENT